METPPVVGTLSAFGSIKLGKKSNLVSIESRSVLYFDTPVVAEKEGGKREVISGFGLKSHNLK